MDSMHRWPRATGPPRVCEGEGTRKLISDHQCADDAPQYHEWRAGSTSHVASQSGLWECRVTNSLTLSPFQLTIRPSIHPPPPPLRPILQGEKRISAMTEGRSDWCISRQRSWGVPIPAFFHVGTGEALLTEETIEHVCGESARISRLLPPLTLHDNAFSRHFMTGWGSVPPHSLHYRSDP